MQRLKTTHTHKALALLLAVLLLVQFLPTVVPSAQAASGTPLSSIESVKADSYTPFNEDEPNENVVTYLLETTAGEKVRVMFYKDDLFRIWVANSGTGEFVENTSRNSNFSTTDLPDYIPEELELVALNDFGAAPDVAQVDEGEFYSFKTETLELRAYKNPFLFELRSAADGKIIWSEAQPIHRSTGTNGPFTQVMKTDDSEYFYGGGMQVGYVSHKGRKINITRGGWNIGGAPNPVPFYLSTNGYGVYRRTYDTGTYDFSMADVVETVHNEPRFDAYYFYGPSFEDVLDGYTELSGRPHLLPKWGIGLGDAGANRQQYDTWNNGAGIEIDGVRYYGNPANGSSQLPSQEPYGGFWHGYEGTTGVGQDVIDQYINKGFPLSWVLPQDGYGCEYNKYTHPGGGLNVLTDKIKPYGIRLGLWVGQPSNYTQASYTYGYAPGASAAEQAESFAKEIHAQAEWGVRMYKIDVAWSSQKSGNKGVAAILNQMYNNIKRTGERGFAITVYAWAGAQKYAVPWSGDQSGSNDYAEYHIPTFTGSSMSGLPYTTSDTAAIYNDNPGLYVRDLQSKALTPMTYAMSNWGNGTTYANANPNGMQNEFGAGISTATSGAGARATSDKRPSSGAHFTDTEIAINWKYAMLQRTLIPYIYSYVRKAHDRGTPIVRPMVYNYQNDPYTYDDKTQYQYMSGDWLLAAPVINPPLATVRENVYLPAGRWIDYWSGEEYFGPKVMSVAAPYDTMPIFVRAGAIIPMQQESTYDGQDEYNGKELDGRLILDVYPEGETSFDLYDDDGYTFEYEEGKYAFTKITSDAPLAGNTGSLTVTIGAAEGEAFEGQLEARKNELRIHTNTKPGVVKYGDTELNAYNNMEAMEASANGGWFYDADDKGGILYVLTPALSVRSETVVWVDRMTTPSSPETENALPLPGNVKAVAPSYNSVQVTWDAVPGAAVYEIELDGGAVLQIPSTSYTHSNLSAESIHTYRVRALNATQYSGWTLPVRGITQANNAKVWLNTTGWTAAHRTASGAASGSSLGSYNNLVGQRALEYDRELVQMDGNFHSSVTSGGNNPSLDIDMKSLYVISELEYVPRGDTGNGTINNYRIYTSLDGTTWTLRKSGSFTSGGGLTPRWATLDTPVMCRYVRFQNANTNTYVSGNYVKLYSPQGNVVYNSAAAGKTVSTGDNIWQTATALVPLTGVTASTVNGDSESSGGYMPGSLTDGNLSEDSGWRTEYISNPPHFPYTLNLSFSSAQVRGLTYYPLSANRSGVESANEGDITKFAVYARSGSTRTFLIGGEWPADGQPHTVYFRSTTATALEFVVVDAEGRFGGASEFQVLTAATPATEMEPVVEMNYRPEYAVDGRADTAWSSREGEAATLEVDLGVAKTIDLGRVYFGREVPAAYTIQYKNAQGNWVDAVNVTGNSDTSPWMLLTSPVQAQYWRFTTPARSAGVTVISFELYAQDTAEELLISDSELNLVVGDIAQLTAEIIPTTARDHTVIWSTSDATVADVNVQTGRITAYGGGSAVITATSKGNPALTKTCVVNVAAVPVNSVLLNKSGTVYIGVGEAYQLEPSVLPANATVTGYDWSSGNDDVVSVSNDGFIKGLKTGSSVITVTSGGQSASVTVQVVDLAGFGTIDNTAGLMQVNFAPSAPDTVLKMSFTATYDDGYGAKSLELFNLVSAGGSLSANFAPFPANSQGSVTVTLRYKDGQAISQVVTVPKAYVVTFDNQNADVDANPSVIYVGGDATTVGTLPSNPIRAQYTFGGWFTERNGKGTQFFADTTVNADITLYAYWKGVDYTVTFVLNNGGDDVQVAAEYGAVLATPANPVREAYQFIGWYKDEALTTPWNFDTDLILGDITLYAKWAYLYTVTFNANGGSEAESVLVPDGQTVAEPVTAKDGYIFMGWCSDEALANLWDFDTPVTKDMTLYAWWVSTGESVVTFNTNGGSEIAPRTVANGTVVGAVANPLRDGDVFAGWYKDEALTQAWDLANDLVSGYMTLYAKWVKPLFYYGFENASELNVTGQPYAVTAKTSTATVSADTGIKGGSLSLSANNGYVRIDANSFAHTATNFTISMWIKPTSIARQQFLFTSSTGDDWFLMREGGYLGSYYFGSGNDTYSHTPIAANEWTSLTVTKTSSAVTYYINGVQVASSGAGSWLGSATGFFALGGKSNSTTSTGCFTGNMDEVRFFNIALSADQVVALYDFDRPADPIPVPAIEVEVSAGALKLAAGYAANIPVTVTVPEDVTGDVYAALYDPSGAVVTEALVVDGKATLKPTAAMMADSGADAVYTVGAYAEEVETTCDPVQINVASMADIDLWNPTVMADAEKTMIAGVVFGSGITQVTGGTVKLVFQSGEQFIPQEDYTVVATSIMFKSAIPYGTKLIISGIKYPDLFPSYKFTFTITLP